MYQLVHLLSPKSLVNLATWILQYGTENQKAFVKGQLNNLS
jgi:hypothetical protein